MKSYTMKIERISTENNSHLDVDCVEVEISTELVDKIAKTRAKVEPREFMSIDMEFNWLYQSEESQERIKYEELYVYGDGDLIARGVEKHSMEDIESGFFRIKEVDAIIGAKEKANVRQIEVCINKLDNFAQDEKEKELLVQFADLTSQSDLESKIILYADSLEKILDELEDEDEYIDADFDEFKTRINNLIQADVDQYIFD